MLDNVKQNYSKLVSYFNPKKEGFSHMEQNGLSLMIAHLIALAIMITIASFLTYITLQIYDPSISFETVRTVLIAFYLSGLLAVLVLSSPLTLLLFICLYISMNQNRK